MNFKVQSTLCLSLFVGLLLSMLCLISAVPESSILVLMEDPQLTNTKSARQITCAQVEKHLQVYKRSSHSASALI